MKKLIVALVVCFSIFSKAWSADVPATRNLIPVPAEVTWQEGSLKIDANFRVMIKGVREPRVEDALKRFQARLAKRTHVDSTGISETPALTIQFQDKGLPVQSVKEDESYDLTITRQRTPGSPRPPRCSMVDLGC